MSSIRPMLLAIAGTRPEALKLAPVVRALKAGPLAVKTCLSGQHRELMASVLVDLDLDAEIVCDLPDTHGDLSAALAALLYELAAVVAREKPDGVLVQGDTHTALAGALAAFYQHVPVFHVEAGLRTRDPATPFPEEMNRRLLSRLAALHFAPTTASRDNLVAEGVDANTITVTGNTVIDALHLYAGRRSPEAEAVLGRLTPGKALALVTLHRRENRAAVGEVARAVQRLVLEKPEVEVLWLLHMNGMREQVVEALSGHRAVHLVPPQSYRAFVHLMQAATLILTDSGGVQEEAPALGKPVLVLRGDTERREAVEAGSAELVGLDSRGIVRACVRLLDDKARYEHMSKSRDLFGDGHAAQRIADALAHHFLGHTRRVEAGRSRSARP